MLSVSQQCDVQSILTLVCSVLFCFSQNGIEDTSRMPVQIATCGMSNLTMAMKVLIFAVNACDPAHHMQSMSRSK